PSQCVTASPTGPDGGACIAKTCADYLAQNKDCGKQSDGCGSTIDCGKCTDPQFCGGGGPSKCAVAGGGVCVPKTCADYAGKCGAPTCKRLAACPAGLNCGEVADGCGGMVSCGGDDCVAPAICGGGGTANVCGGGVVVGPGGGACVPLKVCPANACGPIADG